MVKKIFNPLIWLGVFALANFSAAAVPQLFNGQGAGESAWVTGAALAHDTYYETSTGFAITLLSVIAIGLAVFTSGGARGKMAVLFGGAMIAFLATKIIYSSSNDYEFGGPMLIIPFAVFSCLTLSGILHRKGAE